MISVFVDKSIISFVHGNYLFSTFFVTSFKIVEPFNCINKSFRVERLIKLRFLRRAKDETDGKKEEPKDPPFRNFAATGKYLHENDKRWCLKHTKLTSEKDILKWLKRFRTLCPKGQMGMEQVKNIFLN